MRIKRLIINEYRGIRHLDITFPGKGNSVFVGINGAGKTTILDCIINCLRTFQSYLLYDNPLSNSTHHFFRNEVNEYAEESSNNTLIWAYGDSEEYSELPSSFKINKTLHPDVSFAENKKIEELVERIRGDVGFHKKTSIPIVVFYPSERAVFNPNLKPINLNLLNQFTAWEGNFARTTDFNSFFTWFRSAEDYENEMRLTEDATFTDIGLNAVRLAIEEIVGFTNPRVKRQPYEDLVLNKGALRLSLTRLSHGEKTLIAMTGDLARRLALANPALKNPLVGQGIVLIDEIELHFHPSWQRQIMLKLETIFPNIQFIITTHSPQVLSNVKRENVFVLEDFKLVKNTPHTYGKDSNSILWDLFGVRERPDNARKDFSKLYRLLDDPTKDKEAQNMLNDLEVKYGKSDPDLLEAKHHYEFMTR